MNDILSKPHICIKKTPGKKSIRRWFWNKKCGGIINSCGQRSEINIVDNIKVYSHDCKDLSRNEPQVGDQVLYITHDGGVVTLMFCLITSDLEQHYELLGNSGKRVQLGKTLKPNERIILVDHNVGCHSNDRVRTNIINAQIETELKVIESFFDVQARHYFLSKIENLKIGEGLFKDIHLKLFGYIYQDSGEYRTHEVVVGVRNNPTTHPDYVAEEMSLFFRKLANPYLRQAAESQEKLVSALVLLHVELARIHPFEDGNGRSIRLLSELLALKWGYYLSWDITNKHKRYYHDAVRIAVNYGNKSKLAEIIKKSLTQI